MTTVTIIRERSFLKAGYIGHITDHVTVVTPDSGRAKRVYRQIYQVDLDGKTSLLHETTHESNELLGIRAWNIKFELPKKRA